MRKQENKIFTVLIMKTVKFTSQKTTTQGVTQAEQQGPWTLAPWRWTGILKDSWNSFKAPRNSLKISLNSFKNLGTLTSISWISSTIPSKTLQEPRKAKSHWNVVICPKTSTRNPEGLVENHSRTFWTSSQNTWTLKHLGNHSRNS